MWSGQSWPVASTGMSSYLSKLIPVFIPENSSLITRKEKYSIKINEKVISKIQLQSRQRSVANVANAYLGSGHYLYSSNFYTFRRSVVSK